MKTISADILQIPLYHQELSVEFIREALTSVNESQLIEWEINNSAIISWGKDLCKTKR